MNKLIKLLVNKFELFNQKKSIKLEHAILFESAKLGYNTLCHVPKVSLLKFSYVTT